MVIYRIEDTGTGKGYIGKTSREFSQRKKEHLKLLERNKHHNPYLQNIFNKNRTRLKFYILEQYIETEKELNLKEIKWIEKKGELNIHEGGTGGDTLSNHPDKKQIFERRKQTYMPPKGKANPNYKILTLEQKRLIEVEWKKLEIKSLKSIEEITGISKYLCRRLLVENGYDIKNRNQVQKEMYRKGLLKGSRDPNFTDKQKEFIRKRYQNDWIGCKNIAKELGLKSESSILKVIKELGILRSRSEWTAYKNKNRKYKKDGKTKNTQ